MPIVSQPQNKHKTTAHSVLEQEQLRPIVQYKQRCSLEWNMKSNTREHSAEQHAKQGVVLHMEPQKRGWGGGGGGGRSQLWGAVQNMLAHKMGNSNANSHLATNLWHKGKIKSLNRSLAEAALSRVGDRKCCSPSWSW